MVSPELALVAARGARGIWGAGLCLLLVAASLAWLWGYTVDDALVTCRMAAHLAAGVGYRFNAGGPVVDAVTPLGFAHLLAPFASGGPLAAFGAAKLLGAAAWLLAAAALGRRVLERAPAPDAVVLVVLLAGSLPLGAWAVSGMETGVVTALAVVALGPGKLADAAAALAAAWRPELAPWCASVRLGLRLASGLPLARALGSPALVLAAVVAVGVLRMVVFGRAAPLALFAKPSDLAHGLSYASYGFVHSALPLLCLAPFALKRGAPVARAVALAGALHFVALALAGGDWMAMYRLVVPVLPSFVLAGAELSRVASRWASALRLLLAGAMTLYLAFVLGPSARAVGSHRLRLIEQARAPLLGARSIATLDVGWVGATTSADVFDLAGITDESVAMLPGGHTSKRVDDGMLRARNVDALVLLVEPSGEPSRAVEARVSQLPSVADFELVASLPLGGTRQSYVILRKP